MTSRSTGSASAIELGRGVADGSLSPVALTTLALDIARQAEPAINAYVALRPEKALAAADMLEREAAQGVLRSPLHGVPIALKDNMYLAGEPSAKGSRTSSDKAATVSAPIVDRLLRAGSVVIGRTTMPEFGWKGTGSSPLTGITRNPWNLERNSGGSSAGSGATVASGAVPIAMGTDAGGSIRIPAAFCGVVGFKPTLGALPIWPGTVNETLSHAGPLTRSVADARAVFELTRGADPRDPQSAHVWPLRDDPERPLRVGVVRAPFGISPEPGVDGVVDTALGVLRESGIVGREVELPMPVPRSVFEAMWVTGRGLGFASLITAHADLMDPGLVRLLALAQQYSLADFYTAQEDRRMFTAEMFAVYDSVDLLVMPTMPITAFAAQAEVPAGGELTAALPWITWTPYTYPFNITGQPAITLPCGFEPQGLPVGLQVVGPWGHDLRVLDFAERCQNALIAVVPARTSPLPSA